MTAPFPAIAIGINPWPLGLTGLPSWFWIDGYGGQVLTASRHIAEGPQIPAGYPGTCPRPPGASLTVTIQLSPLQYAWSFGDAGPSSLLATTSLGAAYPQTSDIQHLYQDTSLNQSGGFPIAVTAQFQERYQANGGSWQDLRTVARTYGQRYQVQQAQSVLVSGA